ncbi:hypothetical protein R5R35_013503 [Gryllus longicercus]|uniref:Vacuolar protein sorting-associated protein 11 homolog n=1 Tax=Gryllus longicercus TaxID=2509291 RepID=A0AAN9V6X6_9ORTH
MAFLEWRRFNFFDLNKDVDNGKIAEALKEAKVVAATSGHGHLVLGDSEGNIHLVTRLMHVTSFRAYALHVVLAEQLRHSPLLVTVGEDEPGEHPVLKVWYLDRMDKQGHPSCVRLTRASPSHGKVTPASALCVHDSATMLAIGFSDGSILLLRGDITRERGCKQRTLRDGNTAVTGLSFLCTAKHTLLFVATNANVFFFNITHKEKEQKVHLDGMGCAPRCSVLAESLPDSQFMIGREDAVYCYTPDGRGPCYAVEGQKQLLQWFRTYLIIVAQENKTGPGGIIRSATTANSTSTVGEPGSTNDQGKQLVTVLDIQNKFIVFSAAVREVQAVLAEWGAVYLLTGGGDGTAPRLWLLQERDLQSKLALLFKKNLYDVSIRIAKSQKYDAEGLVDIFRQYGDHLYAKGDHSAAIEQYIRTIGRLEPSYIIRKFLDSQHIDKLTTYLQALHKQGLATGDHTTLLLNCYTKLNHTDRLKEFILTKDREVDFDVEIAIKVCRHASPEDALLLARKHAHHDWVLKIQTEDRGCYKEALEYIASLDFEQAESMMRGYGSVLLQHVPAEATALLKQLCTAYRPQGAGPAVPAECADAEDFLHLFLNNSSRLVEFLEHVCSTRPQQNALVYNALFEHRLHLWAAAHAKEELAEARMLETQAVRLLQSPDANYDKEQALVLCQALDFRPGLLHLYEENKLYQQIVQYHLRQGDYSSVLAACRRFGNQDPSLWIQALLACAKDADTPSQVLGEVLSVIEKERLLPPLLVVDALASAGGVATLGDARKYLLSVLAAEGELLQQENTLIEKYKQETERLREQIRTAQTQAVVFQGARCWACHHPLELPSVHFLCQHSYHQHCFQSFAENENECPACLPNNKKILDIIRSQEQSRDLHETFHSQLERAEDGFSLVADYFGRGVFNKLTVVTDSVASTPTAPAKPLIITKVSEPLHSYGPGAEARIRLGEGQHSQTAQDSRRGGGITVPVPEGRMRQDEGRPLTTVDLNPVAASPPRPPVSRPLVSVPPVQLVQVSAPAISSTNPFEEDESYDEAKNPFAEDNPFTEELSTNPFSEDEDYDKNLNPFES